MLVAVDKVYYTFYEIRAHGYSLVGDKGKRWTREIETTISAKQASILMTALLKPCRSVVMELAEKDMVMIGPWNKDLDDTIGVESYNKLFASLPKAPAVGEKEI